MMEEADQMLRCDVWVPAALLQQFREALTLASHKAGRLWGFHHDSANSADSAAAMATSQLEEQPNAFFVVQQRCDGGNANGDAQHLYGGGGDSGCHKLTPPTYIRREPLTKSFQGMVNTYGVPRYQEANPALLAIVCFPFLFGVMYGDVGHGACVLIFGVYLVFNYEKLQQSTDPTAALLKAGRWMLVLMGFFALYAGFMYNDFFAIGFDIFGSRFVFRDTLDNGDRVYTPDRSRNYPYPFGLDPAWRGASNELLFTNSFKMKFSVIVGLCHMTAGMIMKLLNCIHFRNRLELWLEWLPQMLFLWVLIGYMDFLIIYKWAAAPVPGHPKPSIITTMLNMIFFAPLPPEEEWFLGQGLLQQIIPVVAIVCVPWMLLAKPIAIHLLRRARRQRPTIDGGGESKKAPPRGELTHSS
eukprot:GHVU01103203.1.p1 GENE.GHVU01103203.1~~GHVU01103203.1.p1  ORF type:complete len:434 (-),score=98.89 GHVU01103203.1:42-1280(-)